MFQSECQNFDCPKKIYLQMVRIKTAEYCHVCCWKDVMRCNEHEVVSSSWQFADRLRCITSLT